MSEYTDSYGDSIILTAEGGLISVNTDSVVQFWFSKSGAVALAEGILAKADHSVVPLKDIPSATNVSFNEAMMRLACVHKRTVQFRYQKANGGYIESRRFNPTGIVGKDDTLGAEGTDPDRGALRRFNLGRIQGEVSFA